MKKLIVMLFTVYSTLLASAAWATPFADITYDYTQSGSTYTFNLTVKNTYTSNLDFFLINLDADADTTLYTNIAWNNGRGWTTAEFQDDTAFGGIPGVVMADDALIFGGTGGIASGATLSGFTFQFDYTGSILPVNQTFSYLASFGTYEDQANPNGYSTLYDETGTISYFHQDNNNPVPEPGTILLLGAGIAGMGLYLRRRRS